MKGIGIVFDIQKLGGGFYGNAAWRIFMRNLNPGLIAGCALKECDTKETLLGKRRECCIAVFGSKLDPRAVEEVFQNCSEKGLADPDRRFLKSPELDLEPLAEVGTVDSKGRFVKEEWNRAFHDRCKDSGWGFSPKKVAADLSPELKSELETLKAKTVAPLSKRPWWKFW